MKVSLKPDWAKRYPTLTIGNVYRVLEIGPAYRILDDCGEPALFQSQGFHIVDGHIPDNWHRETGDEGEFYATPPDFDDPPYFFERWFDGDRTAKRKLSGFLADTARAEAEHYVTQCQYFRETVVTPSAPRAGHILVECDRDGGVVRLITVESNGDMVYEDFELDIPANRFRDAEPITRQAFERCWDDAIDQSVKKDSTRSS